MTDENLHLALFDADRGTYNSAEHIKDWIDVDYTDYKVIEGELPGDPEEAEFDGVIISGSSAAVYSEKDWVENLKEYVDRSVQAEIPHLGICFGHQTLATVLGGKVERAEDMEIGYKHLRGASNSVLLDRVQNEFVGFEAHQDKVRKLPVGARLLARDSKYIEGFRWRHVFGSQFHPEMSLEAAEEIFENEDDPSNKAHADDEIQELYEKSVSAKTVFGNFERYVRNFEPREARNWPEG
ncbi:MAG: type 1 glutamine amidotransferase [Halobacteria archaeon]